MLENRNLKRDLAALALLAAVLFLAASLFSYDAADPLGDLVYPQNIHVENMCGRWGAMVAQRLFDALGLGAYFLLFSMALLNGALLLRHDINRPAMRFAGWLLALAGFTAFVAMATPSLAPSVVGAGGYLGAVGEAALQSQFASVGSYIIAFAALVGGLFLSTDYLLLRLTLWCTHKFTQSFGRGVVEVGAAYAQKINPKRTDLDGYEPAEGDGVAIRVSGRPALEVEVEAKEEAAEDEEAGEEAEAAKSEEKSTGIEVKKAFGTRVGRAKKKGDMESLDVLDETELPGAAADYQLPSLDLLLPSEEVCYEEQEKEVLRKAKILEKTFLDFGFHIRVVEIQTGPVIAQFEVELEAGLRLSKISGLSDDLAIALRVPSVRIVAPLPGKNTVGVEVPNETRQIVHLREVMEEASGKAQKMRIPVYLGKDVAGVPLVVDLTTLPHLLIAGRTGTGKSVCLNSIIASVLMTRRPDEVRMLMIDPKMVELSQYKCLPHLMHPVVTDMRKAEAILGWAVEKMEERYHLLARAGVRHVKDYNQLGEEELMERIKPEDDEERRQIPTHIPYIVIVADELADLMMTAAKEVESHIIRLAQKSRAVGIHLVLATQKPTVDVITGLIKSNLPARIAFQVASRTDSRVVLDEMGADKLLGNGDMLFLWPGTSTLLRGQGTYLSDDEISKIIGAVATDEPEFVKELVQLKSSVPDPNAKNGIANRDELYESAIDIVVREGRGSVSLLQRALGIGYGRAARLIDFMAEDGIVGPYNGSQAREILMTLEQWQQMTGEAATAAEPPARPRHSSKIVLEHHDPEPEEELPGKIETVKAVGRIVDDRRKKNKDEDEEAFEDEEAIDGEEDFDADDSDDDAPFDADEEADEDWQDEEDWDEDDADEDDDEDDDPDDEEDADEELENEDAFDESEDADSSSPNRHSPKHPGHRGWKAKRA